jgi:MFS family permease
MFSLFMLVVGKNPILVTGFFILYIASNNLMVYSLDIFVEHFSQNSSTGKARGLYLMITNLAWMLSPFVAGVIVSKHGFSSLYSLVICIILFVFLFIRFALKKFKDSVYLKMSLLDGFSFIKNRPNIIKIIILNFFLQFFFSWMIVFTPIYLREIVGFGYGTIGIIFMVMLSPFVLLQLPLGILADKKLGEKEMLIIGFIIMGLSTILFGAYGGASPIIFAVILFFTRVGASTIEVMCETYFFKQINDNEPEIISLYRTTTPIAFIVAPLIGSFLILRIPFSSLYSILGILVLIGTFFILRLKDTK